MPSRPGGAALDYIRGNLFDHTTMRALPATSPGPDNDLADRLEHFVAPGGRRPNRPALRLRTTLGARDRHPGQDLRLPPGNGVHDIHMNQGNCGRFAGDDGVWQDGGLLLHFPADDQWVAIFLAFQSQAWHTDDTTGHPAANPDRPRNPPRAAPTTRCGSSAP